MDIFYWEMEALILAAGYGSRLRRHLGIPKYFIDIHGYPLIYYPYYSLSKAGISKIHFIFNLETYSLFREVEDLFNLAEIEVLVNPYPELDNGYTLVYGLSQVGIYPIIVSVSDHIYPYTIISNLLSSINSFNDADFMVVGDSSPDYVDVDEATKILVASGKIKAIGKTLSRYTYIDMGIFLFNPSFRRYVDPSYMEPYTINDFLNRVLSLGGIGRVLPNKGLPWKDVDTLDDYNLVSKQLFKGIFRPYFKV